MYIQIQKKIHCEPCKDCGARPVIEQLPKSKFKIICPSNKDHYKAESTLINNLIEQWNKANTLPAIFRKVG